MIRTVRIFAALLLLVCAGVSCTKEKEWDGDGSGGSGGKSTLASVPFSQNDKLEPSAEGAALLKLRIAGGGQLASAKLQSASSMLCGRQHKTTAGGKMMVLDGCRSVVYNLASRNASASSPAEFSFVLLPGTFPDGLDLTLCDRTHRVMRTHLDVASLSAGETQTLDLAYEPDPEIAYYQGFDACVWGGRRTDGENAKGYAPAETPPGVTADPSLTGYEACTAVVPFDQAGTGYFQPNDWSAVSTSTVGALHAMSAAFIRSRNFGDIRCLFRAQEFQGCIGFGLETASRGIFHSAPFAEQTETWADYEFSFRFMAPEQFADNLLLELHGGGVIRSVSLDGVPLAFTEFNPSYSGTSIFIVDKDKLSGYAEKGVWRTFKVGLSHVVPASSVRIQPATVSMQGHAFFLDDVTFRKTGGSARPADGFRLLYWNIQDGMWADQANDYDHFVAFVKRYDPDVCVWCEASTIYYFNNGSASTMPKEKRYLPDNWGALAQRYGHGYHALGGWRDNFPQAITSKYPITTLGAFTGPSSKPIQHGAGLFKIQIGGKDIYFVTLHTWPQSYKPGASDQAASTQNNEGSAYRKYEMEQIIGLTVNAPAYKDQANWLMMGDFNSRTVRDNWYYQYGEDKFHYFWPHDVIDSQTDLVDVIGVRYPHCFFTTTHGNSRIDFVYASPAMYATVEDALVITDAWTRPVTHEGWAYKDPSDHRPVLVDFNL